MGGENRWISDILVFRLSLRGCIGYLNNKVINLYEARLQIEWR